MKKIISLVFIGLFLIAILPFKNTVSAKSHAEVHHVETRKVETVRTEPTHTEKTTETVRTETTKVDDKNKTIETKKITETKEVRTEDKTKVDDKAKADNNNDDSKDKSPLTAESSTKVTDKIPDYFKEWLQCSNHCDDKTLTYNDILKLVENPNIGGQEAATLAALITYINGLSNPNAAKYTLSELKKLFSADTGSIYSWYYKTAIANINNERALPEKDKLFGRTQEPDGKWHSGITKNTQIIQNGLGDCFTLSSINGMLNHPGGAEKLESMITSIPGHPDEYWVNFPGYSKPILVKLTPTKLAMYSELATGGKWLAIMSDAVARARKDNPESGIFVGGYQTFILHLLTGKPYRNEALSPFTKPQVELLKGLNDKQYDALEYLLTGSTNSALQSELENLSNLTPAQLKAALTKDQLKAFKDLTPAQLATLESLTAAQWTEVLTLIASNAGYTNIKLLDRSLKADRSQEEYSDQLNKAINEDKPPHIVGIETTDHDLTIIGYNATTGVLTIKNPWGTTGWYNPTNGAGPDNNIPKNGTTPPWYDMKNGIFTANLSQLVVSGFVTITIPITRTDDETKKLADKAKDADQPGGQISTMKTQISQADVAVTQTKDDLHSAEIQAAIKEANAAVTHLTEACKNASGCESKGTQVNICQQELANAAEEANAAQEKLSTIVGKSE